MARKQKPKINIVGGSNAAESSGGLPTQFNDAKEKAVKMNEIVRENINIVASTEAGRITLNFLMHSCGFTVSSVTESPLGKEAVMFNEGRRSIWVGFRRFIKPNRLKEVEFTEILK